MAESPARALGIRSALRRGIGGLLCSDHAQPPHEIPDSPDPRAAPGAVALDNGSIFAAHKTIDVAVALNLAPCFTPIESPVSNGMAEAFVKTFKSDYVRGNPIPNAAVALALIDHWMEDYNTVHPHSRLGYRSPREYIALLS
jgi:transposase InsO family protein